MSNEKKNMESDPYQRIQFKVVGEHGTRLINKVECGLNIQIEGLKEDFERMLAVEAERQVWFHDETLLDSKKTLLDYGFPTKSPPIIIVKSI